jgi:hypothetical protein
LSFQKINVKPSAAQRKVLRIWICSPLFLVSPVNILLFVLVSFFGFSIQFYFSFLHFFFHLGSPFNILCFQFQHLIWIISVHIYILHLTLQVFYYVYMSFKDFFMLFIKLGKQIESTSFVYKCSMNDKLSSLIPWPYT